MTQLRRGFKTWCENASSGYRRDLGLPRLSPLDPRVLAQHLGVEVLTPTVIPGVDERSIAHLLETEPDAWSGVTLKIDVETVVIMNPTQPPGRYNNTLAHELAHIILRHEASRAFVLGPGLLILSVYNLEHELEADYFAGALLVPRDALLQTMSVGMQPTQLQAHFGVSGELLQMRRNLTGVDKQLSHARRRA